MQKIVSSRIMRESDAYTCENITDSKELMLRAGMGIKESFNFHGKIAIVCGSGNNAGDGYVLAKLLFHEGVDVTVFRVSEKFSPDGKYYFDMCALLGVKTQMCGENTDFSEFDIIVDCILGTGFSGEVRGAAADAIDKINASGSFVISADINSGLDSDSGLAEKCVISYLTVSIGTYKQGHFLGMAKDVMKTKKNIDIGIDIRGEYALLCEREDFLPFIKKRKNYSHKGTYGYVGILGGCAEYSGAVKLAGMAALRAGCGVAKLIVPQSISASVSAQLLENILCPLADKDGHIIFNKASIGIATDRIASLAIGMGWGTSDENEKILSYILSEKELPLLIDADGLNTLSKMDKNILKTTKCRVVLTPHIKEFERLSGLTRAEIESDPVACAKAFACEYGVILLLKGPATIVTDGENIYITDRGCAGMATAGSGDVLSGILVGLLGYMDCTPLTVALGAYIAGVAGELAAEENTDIAMTAGDTVKMLPRAWKEMTKQNQI